MKYETFLRRENLTDSTIQNYVWTANYWIYILVGHVSGNYASSASISQVYLSTN